MRGFGAALFAAAFCFLGHPAYAHDTESFGGPGGVNFWDGCGDDAFLVGFSGRAGAWAARMSAVCAGWLPASESFGPESNHFARGESMGGDVANARCPPGHAVAAIQIWATHNEDDEPQFVAAVDLVCEPIRLPGEQVKSTFGNRPSRFIGVALPMLGRLFRATKLLECPPAQLATGFHGRAGDYVDAIGLVCSPAPVLASTPEPVRTESGGSGQIAGRARPLPGAVVEAMQPRAVSDQCRPGFEWRLAAPIDHVCAPSEARRRVAAENQVNAQRTVRSTGQYGRHTCISGHVWRLAFDNDVICVTPEAHETALAENRYHFRRTR